MPWSDRPADTLVNQMEVHIQISDAFGRWIGIAVSENRKRRTYSQKSARSCLRTYINTGTTKVAGITGVLER